MTVPDQGVNLAADEFDAGQQAHRAVAFIFELACEGGVHAGLGRQRGVDTLFQAGDVTEVNVPENSMP
jgi:hypothetical protein